MSKQWTDFEWQSSLSDDAQKWLMSKFNVDVSTNHEYEKLLSGEMVVFRAKGEDLTVARRLGFPINNHPKFRKVAKEWVEKNFHVDGNTPEWEMLATFWESTVNGSLTPANFKQFNLERSEDMALESKTPVTKLYGDGGTGTKGIGSVTSPAPSARYKQTKAVGVHQKTGQPVNYCGRQAELPSQAELAKAGAWFKWTCAKKGLDVVMSQHEKDLMAEIWATETFCGEYNKGFVDGMPGMQVKALLDDGTSGGQELVPEFYDRNIITTPLLTGELLPFVDMVEVSSGSSVESASVSNPTAQWGVAEGTPMTAFNTASLVNEVNSDIHSVNVVLEVGRDFLSDAAVNVGEILQKVVGGRMASELDRVIAVGVGSSTEPLGIFGTVSPNTVALSSGTHGDFLEILDAENLVFSLGKAYRHGEGMRPAFVMNDVNYARFRSCPVGGSDQRRVFGMDHQSYMLLEYPVRIQNDIPNTKIAFACLGRYRLYRRAGIRTEWTKEGKTLALANMSLFVTRARFGGKMVDAGAVTLMEDVPV